MKKVLVVNLLILLIFASGSYWTKEKEELETVMAELVTEQVEKKEEQEEQKQDYIHWVDFQVSKFALSQAYEIDKNSYGSEHPISWIDLLAWTAAHTGGTFTNDREVCNYMESFQEKVSQGEDVEVLCKDLKYFTYYREAYAAVLGGMLGEFEKEQEKDGKKTWIKQYGLKSFHPIAKGFPYQDYDDFGVSRSYGYKRNHLGHDMMGQIGTPIICVESGYVEALGWNQYGGWRIGVRSFDKKRYYYYAHLRQGFPYQLDLKEGDVVLAGEVIGYMGHTGYSSMEDTNNIDTTHLHFGMQLIFDESQKEGNNQIWIDCYQIVKFLYQNQSEVARDDETKEWNRMYELKDPLAEAYERSLDFSAYP